MSIQLALDVSAATAAGMPVDGVLREALKLYDRKRQSAVRRVEYTSRELEMAWTREPDLRYIGQWVALEGSLVVASGTDGKAVAQSARAQGIPIPFMFYVTEPDSHPFAGG
ncbi:MAG: hypothetical protein K2X03_18665 [Bryobacteraceae bacterium]|nr:hypothetical protein [Bryobacteraceae bacterium]